MQKKKRLNEILLILNRNQIYNGLTPEKLTNIFAELGPTFIKLGQVLAMRRDFLPKEYCDELLKLQTNVNPIPYETVLEVIEEELGEKSEEVFLEIDPNPLGSASIAQVHRAVLKDGREVVVKVQRPGIYETMSEDTALIRRAAKILNRFASRSSIGVIDFEATIDEFWETTEEELNFNTEAKNLETFKALNKNVGYADSPGVVEELCTEKILVMDYMPGIEIDQNEALLKEGYDLEDLANKLCSNYIKQVIGDGFFHADPHPGNIRVHDGKIGWIDLGMTGSLSERDRKLFHRALLAVAYNDTNALVDTFLKLGIHDDNVDVVQLYNQVDYILEGATRTDMKSIRIPSAMRKK